MPPCGRRSLDIFVTVSLILFFWLGVHFCRKVGLLLLGLIFVYPYMFKILSFLSMEARFFK